MTMSLYLRKSIFDSNQWREGNYCIRCICTYFQFHHNAMCR